MASGVVGEAIYKVRLDSTGLKSELSKTNSEVESSANKTSGKLGKIGDAAKSAGKAIGVAFAAGVATASAAVAKLAKDSLKQFADYEQLVGGVETLFKDSASQVQAYASKAYQTAGLSANAYMEQATSFSARLIQGLGGDTAKAAQIANKAIVDMSDNANKMGTAIGSIQDAYQGFAKQNYTMLDNLKLGYGGTATEMARLINDSGVLGKNMKVTAKTVNDVSFDKIIEAIHVVQTNLGITGTTAKEAATTISGSVNSMKAAWQNLLVGLADKNANLPALIDQFVETLKTVFANIQPLIPTITQGIVKLVEALTPILAEIIPTIAENVLPPVVEMLVKLVAALVPFLPQILGAFIKAVVDNLPALAPVLVGGIAAAFFGPIGLILGILGTQLLGEIGKWLGGLGEFMGSVFGTIWSSMLEGAKGAWNGIKNIFSGLANFFGSIFSNAWNAVKRVFSVGGQIFAGIVDGITNVFRGVVNAIIGGINRVVAIPFNAINGVLNGLRGINILGITPFGWLPRIGVPQIPYLATGGIVESKNGGQLIVAGEGGQDEWVVPESKMASLIDQINARGAGMDITINVSGTFATSTSEQRKVAEVIAERIQEIQQSRFINTNGVNL